MTDSDPLQGKASFQSCSIRCCKMYAIFHKINRGSHIQCPSVLLLLVVLIYCILNISLYWRPRSPYSFYKKSLTIALTCLTTSHTDDSRDLTHWLSCSNTRRWFSTIFATYPLLSGKLVFHPLILLSLPASSQLPFIHPLCHTTEIYDCRANLIKLTTIKIRLNYWEALHWHPWSILN